MKPRKPFPDKQTPAETTSRPPGPEPQRVKIEGDWQEAVKKAMGKKRPAEGWPEPPKKSKG